MNFCQSLQSALLLFGGLFLCTMELPAQGLNIPSRHYGISIGNSTRFNGLRLNFRDKNIEVINGINITVWTPRDMETTKGRVNGLAIGVPIAASSAQFNGISLAIAGAGAAGTTRGIHLAGVGVGAGVDVYGLNVAGIGVGAGGRIGGVTVAGIGIGGGGSLGGVHFAGIGIGSGQNVKGINLAGVGVGAGGDIAGLNIAGVGIGAGLSVKGLNVAGLGIGGLEVSGLSMAAYIRGEMVKGLAVAPFYHRVTAGVPENPASLRGVGISAFNNIQGQQRGLTIGVLNIADDLKGVQLGLINIARSNRKGLKVLPVFNTDFR
jgi:hypothetical protein